MNSYAACFRSMDMLGLVSSCVGEPYASYIRGLGDRVRASFEPVLILNDRYLRMGRKLGDGGAGDVYLVTTIENSSSNTPPQQFALKKMMCTGQGQLIRARLEFQLMNQRIHPSIMTVIDHKEEALPRPAGATDFVILMPLYTQGSLWDLVQRRRERGNPLTLAEMLDVLEQVAGALQALHHAGYVHCDVKPQNVLVRPEQGEAPLLTTAPGAGALFDDAAPFSCVLTDLGSCFPIDALQVTNAADAARVTAYADENCSPLYRPPELYEVPQGRSLDGRIDTWALGCMLFFMLEGINPFERLCSQGASLVLAVQRSPIPWSDESAGSPLRALATQCIQTDYQSRLSCAGVLQWIEQHRATLVQPDLPPL